MSFYLTCRQAWEQPLDHFFEAVRPGDVQRALEKENLNRDDFLALLSPSAEPFLEDMARRAVDLTIRHFGRTILLFTPLYLSNFCTNRCVYCGYNALSGVPRRKLDMDEVRAEAEAIAATGLKHLLILTGEDKKRAGIDYLEDCMGVLRDYFPSVSIEVFAMDEDEYLRMARCGVDGLTIYQETYDEELYAKLHPRGPKSDYRYRLDAPERGCRAGMRTVNIGALLGLGDWRRESFVTGLHAEYLQKNHPDTDVSISLPRMRPHAGDDQGEYGVEDRHMVQAMLAQRIFLPHAGITISTREEAGFRDSVMPLGVTKMSAGVCTAVGGHSAKEEDPGQFEISDGRSVEEMVRAMRGRGFQPLFKDWESIIDSEAAA